MIEFFKVAELDEVTEGELLPIEVDGEPVCLTKINDVLYAFTDNCTHISGPLHEGGLDNCVVTCPWHMAQFDVRTGKVVRGPARQDLYMYPVKTEKDGIYLGLPPEESS